MAYDKEAADTLLEKLEEHLKKDPDFNASELKALHQMVEAWKGWQALGRAAKWLIVTLGMIAAAVASWSTIAAGIRDLFKP